MDRPILDQRKTDYNYDYLVACVWCGKERWISRSEHKHNKRLCCSMQCDSYYRWSNDPELQQYKYRKGLDGGVEVETTCEFCGVSFWARFVDIKRGEDKFCGNSCSQKSYKQNREDYIHEGFENGRFLWVKTRGFWEYSYRENGKKKHMSGARAFWLLSGLEIPEGMNIHNSNQSTLEIENLSLCGHNWYRDGSGYIHYPLEFSKELKHYIKDRDGNACAICTSSRRLHVHHIDGNVNHNDVENLITVCGTCHLQIHKNPSTTDPTILAFQALLQ